MSIFGSIASAVFHPAHAATAAAGGAAAAPSAPAATKAAPSAPTTATPSAPAATKAAPISQADVEAMIAKIPGAQRPDYDWKHSIVDLMKLLKLDSGLDTRKQLAKELGYTGALDGSAAMNTWLHKKVMDELAQSGGKVPDDLKHHA